MSTATATPTTHRVSTLSHVTTNEELEARCAIALTNSGRPGLANLNISASIDGLVTLTGDLATYFLKQMAQETVRHVPGVMTIKNETSVLAYAG